MGGWCDTYSDINSISLFINSNVSPRIGLNGLENDFSTTVHYVEANTDIIANLLDGSFSSFKAA